MYFIQVFYLISEVSIDQRLPVQKNYKQKDLLRNKQVQINGVTLIVNTAAIK